VTCGHEAIYIGSHESCRVRIDDERIAERQMVIYPERDGGWVVEPLEVSNEVQVNAREVATRHVLLSGDEIQVCGYIIRTFPEGQDRPGARGEMTTSVDRLTKFAQSQLPYGTVIKKGDEKLEVEPEQITRIGEINVKLGACILIEEVMEIALQTLLETFAAQRAWVGVRRLGYGPMEYVEGRTLTGQPAELPAHADNYKPRVLDRAQNILVPRVSLEEPESVLAVPLVASEATLGMLYVDSGDSGRRYDSADLDFIVLVAGLFAVQIQAIFDQIAKNRAATIDGEVGVAHEIQARVTPRKLPQWQELQFGAFREPGREHTGDVYDLVRMQNGMAGFMVAHTPATGPMPSLLMAQAQALFRGAAMHQDEPHVFLRTLNWLLYDGAKDHPLNCFMAYIDPKSGAARYAMAGQTGAYIIGQRGDGRPLGPEEPTPPLATVKNHAYPLLTEDLESAESLVVFTPGVTTAKNAKEETFGEERFVNILCDGFGQLASSMLKEMLTDLRNFTEGGKQPDDITVLLAHRL
jgi:serine phosphatase RsbU (regulator of sigma subunit)